MGWLSVDSLAFTLWGYPMSYIELVGTLLYLWSVWLIAQKKMLTWPVGIASVLLYLLLFYQIQLYSDALEQVYYLFASAYGWVFWRRTLQQDGASGGMAYSSAPAAVAWAAFTAVTGVAAGLFFGRIHLWAPKLFPLPASFPFLDALTTVMSFVAMWLLARKRVESWVYWIIVDVIGIGLYWVKGVRFVALLYVILLVMAINGLRTWHQARQTARHEAGEQAA